MNKKENYSPRPPKWLDKLLEWFCAPHLLEEVQGDLHERYQLRVQKVGEKKARALYLREVLAYLRPSVINKKHSTKPLCMNMFINYLKVACRNLLRHKAFSFINIFGLAVAMSVCMLLILMLADQKSYDQFHVNKDRIYRILWDKDNSKAPSAATPFLLAATLKADYPIVEESTHLTRGVGGEATYEGKTVEMRGYFADPSFFKVFSYPLEKGIKSSALSSPNSMVITRELAHQLFKDEDPVGKTVRFGASTDWGLYTITGIIGSSKFKSHLTFDVLISSSSMAALLKEKKIDDFMGNWRINDCYTYVLLTPQKTGQDLTAALAELVSAKSEEWKDIKGFTLIGQSLSSITPGRLILNEPSFSLPIVAYYFLFFLALAIMLSACLNYTNLSVARALTRAKEIGVRKITGAQRKDLVFQFLSESVITSFFALGMAAVLLVFIKPAFEELWINQYLQFNLQGNLPVYLIFAGFALLIGVVAGAYPALYLSRFQPVKVLKNFDSMRAGKLGIRKVLSVSQFVISLFFITTSILIYNQLEHFLSFEYGFQTKNIVNIPLQGNDYRKVSAELATVAGVSTISACNYLPATNVQNGTSLKITGSEEEYKHLTIILADENFVDNLGIKLLAGRQLLATSDSSDRHILLNEAAVKEFGYTNPFEIIGQAVETEGSKEKLEVVGVVENFVFKAPFGGTDKIGPLVLQNQPYHFSYVNVQIVSKDIKGTIARLEEKWKKIDAAHSFSYEFYDEQLAATNQIIFDVVSIVGFIAFLSIVIACLGMLGTVTYTAERKTKEVGIRKVLGAGNWSIALLLSKGFFNILMLSILIGSPLSFMINNFWLENFPNRVDFGLDTLLLGSLILLVLGLLTIVSQILRVARKKPVDSLRMD